MTTIGLLILVYLLLGVGINTWLMLDHDRDCAPEDRLTPFEWAWSSVVCALFWPAILCWRAKR